MRWLTRREQRALLRALLGEDPPGRARELRQVRDPGRLRDLAVVALQLQLYAGLRVSEVCALRRCDLPLDLTVRGGAVIVRHGKGGKARQVPLSPELKAILARYLQIADVGEEDSLFPSVREIVHSVWRKSTAQIVHAFRTSVSDRARRLPGVEQVVVVMATPANRELLSGAGFGSVPEAGPGDLVIAVRAADRQTCAAAAAHVEEWLQAGAAPVPGGPAPASPVPRTVAAGVRHLPGANLAVVSVPGEYAAYVAAQALDLGLHVFLFSNHVSLADEARLKTRAAARGLLIMGPDCGCALLGGVALGFANRVQRGNIGIVAASGTGTQEVSTLLDRLGCGVSHIIGTGGRDLVAAVEGITMRAGIRLLAGDPGTQVLVVLSKPPDPQVAALVRAELAAAGKPAVVCFLGQPPAGPAGLGGFVLAAAPAIVGFVGGTAAGAVAHTLAMYEITLGEHPVIRIPALEMRGGPVGIDLRRVVETGFLPVFTTGIAHKEPGIGQIGAGLVHPPREAFVQALLALADQYPPAGAAGPSQSVDP